MPQELTPASQPENDQIKNLVPTNDDLAAISAVEKTAVFDLAPKKKVPIKWFFCHLNYKVPPMSYTIQPSNVYDNALLEQWKELGATGAFRVSFSELIKEFRHKQDARRQAIYDQFNMQKVQGFRIFSHTSSAPLYREVLKWADEFNIEFQKLMDDNFDYMVETFRENLTQALEKSMRKHRKDDAIDDIPTEAAVIAREFCEQKFTSQNSLMAGCEVQVPIVGDYFGVEAETSKTPTSMAEIAVLVGAESEMEEDELLKLKSIAATQNLKAIVPILLRNYAHLEVKALGLFLEKFRFDNKKPDDDREFKPYLASVFYGLADMATTPEELKSAKVDDVRFSSDKHIVDLVKIELDEDNAKGKYITTYKALAEDSATLIEQLESIKEKWASFSCQIDLSIDLEDVDTINANLRTFIRESEALVLAKEMGVSDKKAVGRPSKAAELEELFATVEPVEEPVSEPAIAEEPALEKVTEPEIKTAKKSTSKLAVKKPSSKAVPKKLVAKKSKTSTGTKLSAKKKPA
jgi:hypothetical protein